MTKRELAAHALTIAAIVAPLGLALWFAYWVAHAAPQL